LGGWLHKPRLLTSFGAWVTGTGGVCVVLGLGYVNVGCLRHLGARLCELGMFASSGGSVTRTEAVGIIWGRGYESRLLASFGGSTMRTGGVCVVGGTKRGCLRHFEAGLRELRLLALFGGLDTRTGGVASFGALVTRNKAASVVWGLVYMREGCWRRLGAWLCETKLFASLGARLCDTHLLTYLTGLPWHFRTPNAHR